MTCVWQKSVQMRGPTAATFLPPAMVEETGWDILLALYEDQHSELSLGKLGALVSVPQPVLTNWLAGLEERQLIAGAKDSVNDELLAVLTPVGRELLDRYLSAASDLQVGAHH